MTYEPIYEESVDLITIEQLPIVAERFSQMVEPTRERVAEILAMECTEETKNEVKKARTELRRFDEALKSAAKTKKNELFEPWNRVEAEIKRITSICADADVKLKAKIDAIESEQKRSKELEIREYFTEKRDSLGIVWLEFERMNLKIRLSDTLTALRKTVNEFTEKVAADVSAILAFENVTEEARAEIMTEYKTRLSLGEAVKIVNQRRARVAEEAAKMKRQTEEKRIKEERVQAVCEAAQREEESERPLTPPREEKPSDETAEADSKVYTMSFRVSGTLSQLKDLKRYIIANNITILE